MRHVRSDNYTWLCVSCVWAAGPLQSGPVSLQAEEAESVPGLRSSGCAGVLVRPARHRRWTTPTHTCLCSEPIAITTTPTLCQCKSGKTWKDFYSLSTTVFNKDILCSQQVFGWIWHPVGRKCDSSEEHSHWAVFISSAHGAFFPEGFLFRYCRAFHTLAWNLC